MKLGQNKVYFNYKEIGGWGGGGGGGLSQNCFPEQFEIKVVKWCILTLFETMFWKLEQLRKI